MVWRRKPKVSLTAAFIAGLVGGAFGVLAMNQTRVRVIPQLPHYEDGDGENGQSQGEGSGSRQQQGEQAQPQPLDSIALIGRHHRPEESSTAALGRILYTWATGHEPDQETKSMLSNGVHWAYGIAQGGVYGLMRHRADPPDVAGGLTFGTLLWLLGDELMVPALGLQKGPTAYSTEQHRDRLAMHWAYGITTALATRGLLELLRRNR